MFSIVEHDGGKYIRVVMDDFREDLSGLVAYQPVDGILPFHYLCIDGTCIYEYPIRNMHSLKEKYEKQEISLEESKRILVQVEQRVKEGQEYLMEEQEFWLNEELIFLDDEKVYIVWIPGKKNSYGHILEELLEFFMQHMKTNAKEESYYIFDLYRACKQGKFQWNQINEKKEPEKMPIETALPKQKKSIEIEEVVQPSLVPFFICCFFVLLLTVLVAFSGILKSSVSGRFELIKVVAYGAIVVAVLAYAVDKTRPRKRKAIQRMPSQTETVVLQREEELLDYSLIPKDSCQKVIHLTKYPFTVGSDEARVMGVIEGRGISRIHGSFNQNGSKLVYMDRNSTNGTFINDRRVVADEEQIVQDGDFISFAHQKYQVHQNSCTE